MRIPIKNLAVPLVFVALILVARYSDKIAFIGKGDFAVSQIQGRTEAVLFTWRDSIEAPMALRLEERFIEWAGRSSTIVIELSSQGGALREGGKVIDFIDSMKRTHRVETVVGKNRICLSMCVPIFLQGEVRTAHPTSRWMFHQPILTDIAGERAEQRKFERDYTGDRFFDRYFVPSAMDPAWREKLRRDWIGRDVWFTGQELVDQQSGIITQLQ